jgi:predicted transcriptional regulator
MRSVSPRERERRSAVIRAALEFTRVVTTLGKTAEETAVLWSIRLGQYQGREVDLQEIIGMTNLPRATAQRQLAELKQSGKIGAARNGKRMHYYLTDPETPEVAEFYRQLLDILDRASEASSVARQLPDKWEDD